MKTDIEIAKSCEMKPIVSIADEIGIKNEELEPYGHYKAKISEKAFKRLSENTDGKLILVTAINPTPAGEGKTTTTVGLGQAMKKIGKNAVLALREPSLGPVFGIKGGAAGGGYSQVVPMEDINLHFTGDMHAITSANNLLCALIDNHLQQGNELSIDPKTIIFKRVLDMNDRALRNTIVGMGGRLDGVVRQDSFTITVASEIMAILCLSDNLSELRARISNILIGYRYDRSPVFVRDLSVEGAITTLLKDAINPNLVQTLENTPVIIHGGPFANIAHGCNSIRATKLALKLGDYCITEAGFGSDLGAEKFLDIKCATKGLSPACVVLVATVRALKYNGGLKKEELTAPNLEALKKGIVNLEKHIENMSLYGLPVVVAINRFYTDSDEELAFIENFCKEKGVLVSLCEHFAKGGEGAIDLAQKVVVACDSKSQFKPLYSSDMNLYQKIEKIAKDIYGADGVSYAPAAKRVLDTADCVGAENFPVCVAKTQYSLSDNPALLGKPSGFTINVKEVKLCTGAGFAVVLTGDIMTMPGLPKKPAALSIDIDNDGNISGLF